MGIDERNIDLEGALAAFDFGGRVEKTERFDTGHINDTFLVSAKGEDGGVRRYTLQRVNTHVFRDPDALMENIHGVTGYLREVIMQRGGDPERETLTFLKDRAGNPYFTDTDGSVWRVYRFVENAVSYQSAETPELFAASARAFGNFASLLRDYPAHTLHETIPDFHDTRVRFETLKRALEADVLGRAAACRAEIDFALARKADCAVLMDRLDAGELPLRVTHNDTKLNNVLMDPAKMEGVCVIDLDTVMPGLVASDFGDSIRFGATTAAEDEQDLDKVHFSLPLYRTYTEGYLQTAGEALTPAELESLPWGARLMTLECGIRFLTDHLEGDTYFRVHREGHNLDRCRTQFKLVAEMEEQWDAMRQVVAEAAANNR